MPLWAEKYLNILSAAVQYIFSDMLYVNMEDYAYDIIVKARTRVKHLAVLRRVLTCCRQFSEAQSFQMHLWCQLRPILRFLVHDRGVRIDPKKLQAIRDMPPPNSLKKLQCFIGEVNYLRTFYLSRLLRHFLSLACFVCWD